MARMPRVVAVGAPHHVTQRGNNRQDVFLSDSDRRFYLRALAARCSLCDVRLLGYCLMGNHVHMVAVPSKADALARCLGGAHRSYTNYFNKKYSRSGHLWQNRFYSCSLDRRHLIVALAYVDLNPIRAGLVDRACDYAWSSARAHVTGRDPSALLDLGSWAEIDTVGDWADVLGGGKPEWETACSLLRAATRSGSPLHGDSFHGSLLQENAAFL
jgi:REP-associated tyrosine transposase